MVYPVSETLAGYSGSAYWLVTSHFNSTYSSNDDLHLDPRLCRALLDRLPTRRARPTNEMRWWRHLHSSPRTRSPLRQRSFFCAVAAATGPDRGQRRLIRQRICRGELECRHDGQGLPSLSSTVRHAPGRSFIRYSSMQVLPTPWGP